MQIRMLDSNDAPKYAGIRLEALQHHPEAFSSSYEEEKEFPIMKFESRLNGTESFTYGALAKDQLIGVVTLVPELKNKLKHRANIVAMYVDPQNRRFGVGKRLMSAAIEKAKELETIEQIYLSVTANNEPAKNLYHSLGFETYGKDKKALKIGQNYFDDELMVLFI